jgi:negative regulator of sigma E activity
MMTMMTMMMMVVMVVVGGVPPFREKNHVISLSSPRNTC